MSLITPVQGLIGGLLIGLSAAFLLLFNGDILGISGVTTSTMLNPRKHFSDTSMLWKSVFIASLLVTSQLFLAESARNNPFMQFPLKVSPLGQIIGGFLVGFGTKLGSGCTSGHGICGLARLSKRSFVAVATFMSTAFITTFLTTGPLSSQTEFLRSTNAPVFQPILGYVFTTLSVLSAIFHSGLPPVADSPMKLRVNHHCKVWASIPAGAIFATGLWYSGMVFPSKVFGFLHLSGLSDGSFDPTLIFVMGAGVLISFVSYQFVQGHSIIQHNGTFSCPLMMSDTNGTPTGTFGIPTRTTIDSSLVVGSALFGIGWSISAICPGPALFHVATGFVTVIALWWPAYLMGASLAQSSIDQLLALREKKAV